MAGSEITIPIGNPLHPLGEFVGENVKPILDAAVGAMCGFYQAHPDLATGSRFNNPIAPYNDGLLNNLCAPRGQLPPSPQPPFDGGQCAALYNLSTTRTNSLGSANFDVGNGFGKLSNYRVVTVLGQTGSFQRALVDQGVGESYQRLGIILADGQPDVDGGNASFIFTPTRLDGQPDDCGEPQPQYPPTPYADIDFNFDVPVQVSPNFNIDVPVSIYAPINNFSPSLRLGDFNIDFNLGGIDINFAPDITFPAPGTNVPPNKPVLQPPPGQAPSDRDDTEINSLIIRYLKRIRLCQGCDQDYDFFTTSLFEGSEGGYSAPTGGILLTVSMEIIQQPTNAKRQPGRGSADVLYAGWGWFGSSGARDAREPIDSKFKIFYADTEIARTSFQYTLQTGYVARWLVTYKRLKNPIPSV